MTVGKDLRTRRLPSDIPTNIFTEPKEDTCDVDKRRQKLLASTFAVSALTMTGSYTVAGAVRSNHGSDYSEDYNNLRALRSCDREADSNRVKGVYDFDTRGGGNGEIEDTDGSNGNCASTGTSRNISRHRTCEKNHISWDCDNYQNTSGK